LEPLQLRRQLLSSACAIFGALYDGVDLYDTYPPIRQHLRWLA
jgi:hypothetical protein